MVMTKTELKKQLVAAAIDLLENEFGVEFDGTDEGGRLGFTVAGFSGDFSRRDMEVCLWESIPSGVLLQQEAVALENEMNTGLILIDTFG
jgi:hypothetical protein